MFVLKPKNIAGFLLFISVVHNPNFIGAQTAVFDHMINDAYHFQNINIDSSMMYADSALSVAKESNDPQAQFQALHLLVKLRMRSGEMSEALALWYKLDSVATSNNMEKSTADVLMLKGIVYTNAGFASEGIKYLLSAKRDIEMQENTQHKIDVDYYLALAYEKVGEYNLSRSYVHQSLDKALKQNNISSILDCYLFLSNTSSKADTISHYLSLADDLSKKDKNNYYRRAVVLNAKALFFKAINRLNEAKSYYVEAIKISEKNRFRKYLSLIFNNYAYLLMKENKYDSAKLVLDKALYIASELKDIDVEGSVMDTYSDYYTNLGDTENAFDYYKKSVKLKNKFHDQLQIEQSMFLSVAFEAEKKEKEIAKQQTKISRINAVLFASLALLSIAVAILLYLRQKSVTRKNRIKVIEQEKRLEVANALIEGQDAERKRLAMDLHDGISPQMGSLKLMIDANFDKNNAYSEVVSSVENIRTNIRELSHRMLPSQLQSKGLETSVQNFVLSLEKTNHIRFQFYSNLKDRLSEKLEMNLYFLFYELVNNAVKHANATQITVQLIEDTNKVTLSVEDDGKGFDPHKDYRGIGLKNSMQRVNYLGGEITIDSAEGEGTSIIIEINKRSNGTN